MSAAAAAAPVTALSGLPAWARSKRNPDGLFYRHVPNAWDAINIGISAGASQLAQWFMFRADREEGYVCLKDRPAQQNELAEARGICTRAFQLQCDELEDKGIIKPTKLGRKTVYRVIFEKFEEIAAKIREMRRERARAHRSRAKEAKTAQVVSITSNNSRLRPSHPQPVEPEAEPLAPLSVAPGESATITLPEECDSLHCSNETHLPLQVSLDVTDGSLTLAIRRMEGEQTGGGEKAKGCAKPAESASIGEIRFVNQNGVKSTSGHSEDKAKARVAVSPEAEPMRAMLMEELRRDLGHPPPETVMEAHKLQHGSAATVEDVRLAIRSRKRNIYSWGLIPRLVGDAVRNAEANAISGSTATPTDHPFDEPVPPSVAADYEALIDKTWAALSESEQKPWIARGRAFLKAAGAKFPSGEGCVDQGKRLFAEHLVETGELPTLDQYAKGGLARHA